MTEKKKLYASMLAAEVAEQTASEPLSLDLIALGSERFHDVIAQQLGGETHIDGHPYEMLSTFPSPDRMRELREKAGYSLPRFAGFLRVHSTDLQAWEEAKKSPDQGHHEGPTYTLRGSLAAYSVLTMFEAQGMFEAEAPGKQGEQGGDDRSDG